MIPKNDPRSFSINSLTNACKYALPNNCKHKRSTLCDARANKPVKGKIKKKLRRDIEILRRGKCIKKKREKMNYLKTSSKMQNDK